MFVFIITSVWLKCVLLNNLVNVDKIILAMVCGHSDEMSTRSSTVCALTLQVSLSALFSAFHATLCFWWSGATGLPSFWLGFPVAFVRLSACRRVVCVEDAPRWGWGSSYIRQSPHVSCWYDLSLPRRSWTSWRSLTWPLIAVTFLYNN